MRLYSDLAPWFHLLTAPKDYAEEAEFVRTTLLESSRIPIESLLELGSGGGNNAWHLRAHFQMTLVDLSPSMLELSRRINPDCEHVGGDMRNVRLNRLFDAVFVHDAVMYLVTEAELADCLETARVHCRSGGVALFLPDFVKETFVPGIHHGGHDGDGRGLRYIEWTFDRDPTDKTYTVDFAVMLREGSGPVKVEHDRHEFGLFERSVWLRLLREAGFEPRVVHDPYGREVFTGIPVEK